MHVACNELRLAAFYVRGSHTSAGRLQGGSECSRIVQVEHTMRVMEEENKHLGALGPESTSIRPCWLQVHLAGIDSHGCLSENKLCKNMTTCLVLCLVFEFARGQSRDKNLSAFRQYVPRHVSCEARQRGSDWHICLHFCTVFGCMLSKC